MFVYHHGKNFSFVFIMARFVIFPSIEKPTPFCSAHFHLGVYIESSMCWIDDTLLAGNCLTGLSVVRGGFVALSGSDITENGHTSPILIEDAHDARDATNLQGISIRGGVIEGPVKNSYTSLQRADGKHIFKGGVIREGASWLDPLENLNT